MGRHTLVELLHIAAGLVATVAITWASAWSYPLGRNDIWLVGSVAFVVVLLMGVRPVREALAKDRAKDRAARG
ncbi:MULTISPECIES: hypothetical protein [unclassified Sphingomonas]|uniref:hypothetical protein n=1 Tax=unclassified Sphingomonas TaxID=196159 RepID=UPI00082C1167|nr:MULTISPECIES: hypothetical protein [unclassified Sphingomonas]MCH4894142.1 hypothetical protein [Sphingomonas sp. SFZ2018-12]